MSYYGLQVTLIFILTFITAEAKKPPGYVAPPKEYDPNPPKYEYGYRIQEEKATHGKDEQRDGIYAQGRYYVETGTESSQNVKYFADDWGYHPVVEYSNKGPYSTSSTNFALGEEAIKLKNNQKSIPQDPSDPGKAENLAKQDPSLQRQQPQQNVIQNDPSTHQPNNQPQILVQQPQLFVNQPQQVIIENQSEKPTAILPQEGQPQIIVHQDPSHNQPQLISQQPQIEIQATPTPNTQHVVLVSNSPVDNDQSAKSDNNPPQLIEIGNPQTIIVQNTRESDILLHKQPEDIDTKSQPQEVLIDQPSETRSQPQPVFYYVQPQPGQLDFPLSAAGNQLIETSLQPQINLQLPGPPNQLFYPVQYQSINQPQDIVHLNQIALPEQQLTAKQNVLILQKEENLPQPQALIYQEKKQNVIIEEPSGPSGDVQQSLINNNSLDIQGESGQLLETAALTKIPNKIVENSNKYLEFGVKIKPKIHLTSKNLIESTKDLVSGTDVLNINAAISHTDEVETSTLQSLLNQYVTPTIVNNHVNVDVNHFEIVSSTTVAPSVSTIETSLFNEPIVVAEAQENSEHKPVVEKTDENNEYFPSTSRSSLATSTTIAPENIQNFSEQILVTPRPVSSKFLAPITAGVQLQHIEEPIFEDTKTVEINEGYHKKSNVVVQVQKTIPYYLGMYEYPLGYAAQYRGYNMTGQEKAIENIELGKTLLYFPGQESSNPDRLVQQIPKTDLSYGISEVSSNHLTVQQLPSQYITQRFAEADQQALQGEQQLFIEQAQSNQQAIEQIGATESRVDQQIYVQNEQQQQQQQTSEVTKVVHQPYDVAYPTVQQVPYPVEKIVDRPVHVPVQVTKYVDRPYPVEVPVPYPQPYPVEKIVKEPYPVPVHVQVPVPHPVPVEKIVKEPYPVPVHVQVPVEKIVERKVPYYVDRVVEKPVPHYINRPYPVGVPVQQQVPQGYLLQIPGLFSQQKYSTLVHNTYQPQKLQIQYSPKGIHNQNLAHQGVNPYSYAARINQYLPPKQDQNLYRGQKLKKLNLLVFPRIQVPLNLPPVTKNPYDLQQSQSYQSFRHSSAQLDNGYLPPVSAQQADSDHNDHIQSSASTSNSYNIKHPEEPIGLIPPKRPNIDNIRNYRTARSHFDDKSIRLEYGFMPPLIPSLEIDEQGRPVEKDDNKN